mgnify:CR=1 FL=1
MMMDIPEGTGESNTCDQITPKVVMEQIRAHDTRMRAVFTSSAEAKAMWMTRYWAYMNGSNSTSLEATRASTEQQIEVIAHLRPSGYIGTPDFLKILLDAAKFQDAFLTAKGEERAHVAVELAHAREGAARLEQRRRHHGVGQDAAEQHRPGRAPAHQSTGADQHDLAGEMLLEEIGIAMLLDAGLHVSFNLLTFEPATTVVAISRTKGALPRVGTATLMTLMPAPLPTLPGATIPLPPVVMAIPIIFCS